MNMKRASFILAFIFLMLVGGTSVQAEEVASGNPSLIAVEIENQTPCFFFGGYQLSLGVRYERFRFRASIQNSGRADFESTGIDGRSGNFSRSYDNGSFSVSVDYFLNDYLFAYACLGSNRWLVQNKDSSATGDLRTLDAGLGLGFQYIIFKGFFIQLAAHVNFRERQSLIIQNEKYTIPGIDYSPGLRLGYRF
jgi:hypothetical protein